MRMTWQCGAVRGYGGAIMAQFTEWRHKRATVSRISWGLHRLIPNGEHWAIEIKRSTTPKVERGFYSACEDIQPSRRWLIYPGSECYPLGDGIEVMSLHSAMQALV